MAKSITTRHNVQDDSTLYSILKPYTKKDKTFKILEREKKKERDFDFDTFFPTFTTTV